MSRSRIIHAVALMASVILVVAACSAPAVPATPTAAPPAATAVPPTATPLPPTATAVPPTATALPPTAVPPTVTPVPKVATLAPTAAGTPAAEVPRPSNPGGPGPAVNLTGNIQNGIAVYNLKGVDKNCAACHGPDGKGEVANPGSTDGTVPPLNPIDEGLVDKDLKVFAENIDLFIEHGSTPEGPNPQLTMPAWGDDKKLTPQQIADVIAYIMSLNK